MLEAFADLVADPETQSALAEGGRLTFMGALVWTMNRIVTPLVNAAKAVTTHLDAEEKHREAQQGHWQRNEQALERIHGGLLLDASVGE